MSLKRLQQNLHPTIETMLQAFIDGFDFGESGALKQMLAYHMGWDLPADVPGTRGKRIRPLITLLACGAFLDDIQPALPAALAVELLHNFTLIHDDIEDQSSLRHGRATLWTRWNLAQAINAGDALFSIAQLSLLGLTETCPNASVLTAARRFNEVCFHLTQGQHLDIAFEAETDVSLPSYLTMIEGKTAALIALAAELGALAAGTGSDRQNTLHEYGRRLGLAFQIQDDYLGIWGDPAVTGKSAASDLLNKKKTLPILFGLAESTAFRTRWATNSFTTVEIQILADLLDECGAKAYTLALAEEHTHRADQLLQDVFRQPNDYAKALFELTDLLLHRQA